MAKAHEKAIQEGIACGRYFSLVDHLHKAEFAEVRWLAEIEASASPARGDMGVVRIMSPAYVDRAGWYHPARYEFYRMVANGVYTAYGWVFRTGRVRRASEAELKAREARIRAKRRQERKNERVAERLLAEAHAVAAERDQAHAAEVAAVTRPADELLPIEPTLFG